MLTKEYLQKEIATRIKGIRPGVPTNTDVLIGEMKSILILVDCLPDDAPLPEDTVLFNKGVEEGKRLMMEDFPKWLVDDDYHELTEKGRFVLGSVGIGYNGYYIPYSDLLKLPKEDEK